MATVYSADGSAISLTPSQNDIGVRFTAPTVARNAVRALRSGVAGFHESTHRRYGRVMLLHDSSAAAAPVGTVVNALSRSYARETERTLPVFVDDNSGLRLVATEEITVRFKPGVRETRRTHVLQSLDLTVLRRDEFVARQFIVAADAVRSGSRTIDLANSLRSEGDVVEYAAPNFVSEHRKAAPALPTAPRFWP